MRSCIACRLTNATLTSPRRRGALEAHIITHTGAKRTPLFRAVGPHILINITAYTCSFPGCRSPFAARSSLIRHHRVHGKEFAEAAANPQTETTFEAPIVNDQVVGQDLENIQWMTPNQPSRGYTRYSVPTETPGAGPSSLASASMSSAVDPDASAGASTASDNDAGDVAEGVNPWGVRLVFCSLNSLHSIKTSALPGFRMTIAF